MFALNETTISGTVNIKHDKKKAVKLMCPVEGNDVGSSEIICRF